MTSKILPFFLFLLTSSLFLPAQEWNTAFEKALPELETDDILDYERTPDGNYFLYGKRKNQTAVHTFNPDEGTTLPPLILKTNAKASYQTFLLLDDATILAGGSILNPLGKNKTKAIIAQFDLDGTLLEESEINQEGMEEIVQIVATSTNDILFLGKSSKEDYHLFARKSKSIIRKEFSFKIHKKSGHPVLIPGSDNSILLLGFIQNDNPKTTLDALLYETSTRKNFEIKSIIDCPVHLVESFSGQKNADGTFSIFGSCWPKGFSQSEGFFWHIDPNGQTIQHYISGSNFSDQIVANYAGPNQQSINLLRTREADYFSYHLVDFTTENPFTTTPFTLKSENEGFTALIESRSGTPVIINQSPTNEGKNTITTIQLRQESNGLTSKSSHPGILLEDVSLKDENNDNHLSPGERAAIRFKLKNTGNTPFLGGTLHITSSVNEEILYLPFEKLYIDYIGPGKSKIISYAIKGGAVLSQETIPLHFEIQKGSFKMPLFFELNTGTPAPGIDRKPYSLVWKEPDILTSRTRETEIYESKKQIEVTILSNKQVKLNDPVIVRDGVPEMYDKSAGRRRITPPMISDGKFVYTFLYDLENLHEGKNVIQVQIGDFVSDSIILNYDAKKLPTLHLLSIGPKYLDLQYTAKDARDFAEAVTKNIDRRYFQDIQVTTLVDSFSTTTTEIEGTFEEYYNKYQRGEIKNNDYFMVFYSGHGIERNNHFLIVPSNYDPERERSSTIDYQRDIVETFLNKMPCKKVLFLDACLSGSAKSPTDRDLTEALLRANKTADGTVIFTSCSTNELSFEHENWENGAFTEALLDALNGEATLGNGNLLQVDTGEANENGNSIITVSELSNFLKVRVQDLVKKEKGNFKQSPTLSLNGIEENLLLFTLNKD